jgi:hypothetical protein
MEIKRSIIKIKIPITGFHGKMFLSSKEFRWQYTNSKGGQSAAFAVSLPGIQKEQDSRVRS